MSDAEKHENIDPITGRCLDCGASHEAIDDNLYPTCEKFVGPHRVALMILKRERIHARCAADFTRRISAEAAERLVKEERDAQEIAATFEFLKRANEAALESEINAANPVFVLGEGQFVHEHEHKRYDLAIGHIESKEKAAEYEHNHLSDEALNSALAQIKDFTAQAASRITDAPDGPLKLEAELARLRAAKSHVAECEGGNVIITTYHPDRPLDGYIPGKTWWDGEAWQPLPAR